VAAVLENNNPPIPFDRVSTSVPLLVKVNMYIRQLGCFSRASADQKYAVEELQVKDNCVCHWTLVQVLGFNTRKEADVFIQNRNVFVMGAVHFQESDTGQLQYVVQSNTTVRRSCCRAFVISRLCC